MGAAARGELMRILYHHRTTASDGGAVHIEGLVAALRELGVEVHVLGPRLAASPATGRPRARGLLTRIRRALPRWLHELAELAYNVPEYFAVDRAIRRFRPDLVYQRANLYLLSSLWAARTARVPVFAEINAPFALERSRHGGLALSRLAYATERWAWRVPDQVIVVTEVMAKLVEDAGVDRKRLHVMPNGVGGDLLAREAFVPEAKQRLGLAHRLVLGFTGFVRDWNGLDGVVRLLNHPDRQRMMLLIVGDGPARAALEQLADALGVADRVRFTGVLDRAALPQHVSAFDIALQPAANPYASPLKLFEYMALGRAIVAPRQPNIQEILEDGRDALLFEPGDDESLARCIDRLAGDPPLRDRLGRAAAHTLSRLDLTWRRNAERVLALAGQSESALSTRGASLSAPGREQAS